VVLFLGAWLVGWGFGEVSAITMILSSGRVGSVIFVAAWLVLWTVGGAAVMTALAWMAVGKETIAIANGELAVRQSIGRLARAREYDLNAIRNLRTASLELDPLSPGAAFRWLGLSGGRLAFDYGARTYRLGGGLDEAEAEALLGELQAGLPRRRG
jgi:hypothetical protein